MITSIILAAGEGSRMKSKSSKVVHKICGKPLLSYVIDTAKKAGSNKNVVIIGHSSDKVKKVINDNSVDFAIQPIGDEYPYGTGFAVICAKEHINDDDIVVILYGDTPLITNETIKKLIEFHKEGDYIATVLTAEFDDSTGYGRMIRNTQGNIVGIVEHKDADEEVLKIKEVNSGIYTFNGTKLKEVLNKLDNDNAQNEYYITDAIEILSSEGYKVGGYKLKDNTEIQGINSRVQLANAEKLMRKRINESHMLKGVTMINPENTYIDSDAVIGKDTIIYPGVIIEGKTNIGEDCIIEHNTKIINSTIGDRVNIDSSTITESSIDDDTKVGPYAYIRPNSKIGKNVKIGDFVEVKNSSIGDYSKASHLAYIGDALVGKNVNIGCAVVFVNYDGNKKYKTIVEDNAFVGSNSNLVAPVKVEEDGYVAAGSTITEDVKKGSLSIARARQVNKDGWVYNKNK